MEESEKSPIIERLTKFIISSGLTSSQFADKAGIPRPSLSQMLHGRNKSLNNQVLEKLNVAFPHLSIEWLLFGRGDMLQIPNIEISEPQNSTFSDSEAFQPTDKQNVVQDNPTGKDFEKITSNNERAMSESKTGQVFGNFNLFSTPGKQSVPQKEESAPETTNVADIIHKSVSVQESPKKIASIIVLYTDNSFETFVPATDK